MNYRAGRAPVEPWHARLAAISGPKPDTPARPFNQSRPCKTVKHSREFCGDKHNEKKPRIRMHVHTIVGVSGEGVRQAKLGAVLACCS